MNFVPQNDLLCEARKSSEVRILNKLKMDDMKNENNHKKQNKGGRIPKTTAFLPNDRMLLKNRSSCLS